MANICRQRWTDPDAPCEYGDTTDHECWNGPDCTGTPHMHMCEQITLDDDQTA